jgi:hypothetical protein
VELIRAARSSSNHNLSSSDASQIFDKSMHFVLDTHKFSSIIYILYEGAGLSLSVVTRGVALPEHESVPPRRKNGEEGCEGRREKEDREEAVVTRRIEGVARMAHPQVFCA